jgi:superfamily I DNA and RNA helicase
MSGISFIRGRNGKPAASLALEEILSRIEGISGECFFGFPVVATPEGKYSADATLVSPEKGVVLFDLVEGSSVGDYTRRQDDLANKIEAKLKLHRELVRGRNLIPPLSVITFAPAVREVERFAEDGYPLANEDDLEQVLSNIIWADYNENFYRTTLSAIESLSSIRQSRLRREVRNPDSRGAKLKRLEESIATLDYRQNRAVIETVDGVQRIRGLAGSGKTIVLALKAAYLHTQYPDWRIAVTFYTRSLKEQFRRLINNFCIELSGEEPDWEKIRVVNSWGSYADTQAGLYYEFCRHTQTTFYNYREALQRFGRSRAFEGTCQEALDSANFYPELYDAILVDEAQDFAPSFLRLCYAMLKSPKRLVYAYDELQNLSGVSLPPPEEIFGTDSTGRPMVSLSDDSGCDVILKACYRNSRPVLVTAHSLGFGIYRNQKGNVPTGLVQMFDYPALWHEIGYRVREGRLEKGERVVLERTDETSPKFLEDHSPIEDIVVFKSFKNEVEQNAWLIEQIKKNIGDEELRHDDIIVIDVSTASDQSRLKSISEDLKNSGITSHVTGVDTHPDVFFSSEPSVALANIYRAKGNEAGMVYIINAQDCAESESGLATLRNRLFTAITRSKAWVRVLGYGQGMENLLSEFNKLRDNSFKLDFTYPDNELLEKLKVVHQDLSPHERQRLEQKYSVIRELRDAIENGEITSADLSDEDRQVLMNFLQSENH